MTTKQIGQVTVLRFVAYSAFTFFLLPVLFGLIASIFDDKISVVTFYKNLFEDTEIGISFLIVQTIVTLLSVPTLGAVAGQLIIIRNKNKFWVGFLTIFCLWLLLFVSSSLTAGVINSIKYGSAGFLLASKSWFIYGFFMYLLLGLVHASTIGYFLGNKIFKLGQNNKNNL